MTTKTRSTDESGVALITALLATMLIAGLMAGMFAAVLSDQRGGAIDRDQTQAYAAAHAGLEKLTSSLASLFIRDVSPSNADIQAIATTPPAVPGFEFTAPGGSPGSGYAIAFTPDGLGNPQAIPNASITTGPFTGFVGLITPYTMTVTARSTSGGSEVRLRRGIQTVGVPVFQFGMFSNDDLSIFAGGGLNFGGRVHTNGSLFVASQTGAGSFVTFNDRITAVREVVRNFLSNGKDALTSAPSFTTNVNIPTSASTTAVLRTSPNDGSVVGMPGSAANSNWFSLSTGTFRSYIRTGLTGARALNLPLVSQGATNIDLIRRPLPNSNEHAGTQTQRNVYGQRFYGQASVRILLSDRIADFTTLPTITAQPPVLLDGDWNTAATRPVGYGPVDATHPPIARSMGPASTVTVAGSLYAAGLSQIYVGNTAAAIPNVYKLPQLILRSPGGVDQNVICLGKSGPTALPALAPAPAIPANSFFGCSLAAPPGNPVAAIAAGGTIRATVDGVLITRNVPGAVAAGAATTITVGANETAAFSPNLIWMNNPNATVANTAVPVTCQGYSDVPAGAPLVRRFLNCSGLTAAPANGQAIDSSALANQNTGTIGGYIKIERQDQSTDNLWTDVTMEVLNLGIGAENQGGTLCGDPTPTAVIRIQRLRDNGGGTCTYSQSLNSWDWWPNTLYDAREGKFRDDGSVAGVLSSPMLMGGVMQYVSLDVNNLRRWFAGTIGATGNQARNNNGYIVYFSDRRGDHDENNADRETGEYGFEDHINPTSAAAVPDNVLQAGEDLNLGDNTYGYAVGSQQVYGTTPWNDPVNIPAGALQTYTFAGARPWTVIPLSNTAAPLAGAGQARVNKVVLFRRALKLVNGGFTGAVNNLPPGLTVAAENPVYVQGNYNAVDNTIPDATWGNMGASVPAAVIADAITLLSKAWTDARSFEVPNSAGARAAQMTSYRFAAIAGKGTSFPHCGGACGNPSDLYGTDGGAANFLRFLEDWSSSINYRGSLITLHVNRQAIGPYKFHPTSNVVYNGGTRRYTFDVNFLTPALLPPGTPMFRDVNTLQFRQILRPNQ